MPRQVSVNALIALLAETTPKTFVVTLKITGEGITDPIHLVNDVLPLTVGAVVYDPFPFEVVLPTDDADKPPTARIRISNVSQLLVDEIRILPQAPTFELAIRLTDTPDSIEYGPWALDASSASYDINTIEIDLRMRDFAVEPFPYLRYTPNYFPGVFKK